MHLFLYCDFTEKVWDSVMRWLVFSFITPPYLFVYWASWSNIGGNKKIRIIWHATIWSIWQARNHIIFWIEMKYVDELLSEITVLSWQWCLTRLAMQNCLYYEWNWNLQECLIFFLLYTLCADAYWPIWLLIFLVSFFFYWALVYGLEFLGG